jgi:Leucine-rich repeat (LRR) protein
LSFVLEHTAVGVDLIVTGDWTSEAEECLLSGQADGLVLNYARGYREKDLSFVRDLRIRRLDLLARTVADLTPIYSLAPHLVALHIQSDPRAPLDLELLPNLTELSADWRQVEATIDLAPGVERLFLLAYTETDLLPLARLKSLTSLVMKDRPQVRSLDGVDNFPWLHELGIHLASNLVDLSGLERANSPLLEVLSLTHNRSMRTIEEIAACSGLRILNLTDDADIQSVASLAGLARLERLYLGSTRVVDGDLQPIANLPRLEVLAMQDRPHYVPRVREILKRMRTAS